ncbi:hypothetical protein GAO09_09245 [Rhizobiales bacterium RZME27]|uniref:Uncharacterized protein n=1 Tax=Endobacterium cereale TaxID=2663029 RepID=A0A6A8A5A3_9HYPH|nr:hypothetical protein [Endobacterium cereale]MEB2843984.1 hypothetical protein [Endobacterium cereale]MQY46233.1 hypothetical protein [Endobacterium cereale]
MTEYLEKLRGEFAAAEGSFLLALRNDLIWDQSAFSRLCHAMHDACHAQAAEEGTQRWIAEGFWYLQRFVPDWTRHGDFPRVYEPEYYERAYARLDDLSEWFFTGVHPDLDESGFKPVE